MHAHLNSSNLVPPVPEEPGQFGDELAQFCGNRPIIRSEQQYLLLQIQHMAGARQRRRCDLLIKQLQRLQLPCFGRQPVQFGAGSQD